MVATPTTVDISKCRLTALSTVSSISIPMLYAGDVAIKQLGNDAVVMCRAALALDGTRNVNGANASTLAFSKHNVAT
jgi:hypothetical protein